MTIKYGFFNAVNGDRTYQADDFNYILRSLVSNGVFGNPATNLLVTAGNDMSVVVQAGGALVDWHYFNSDASVSLSIDSADVTLNRIDRIVVRLSRTARTIELKVIKGSPATNPVAPAITRTSEVQDLSLATVYIPKQSTGVTTGNITDTRLDSTVCGVIASLVTQLDTSEIYRQYTAQATTDRTANQATFNAFMDQLRASLGDVPATALDQKITALGGRVSTLEARPSIYYGTSTTPPSGWKSGDIYIQYE